MKRILNSLLLAFAAGALFVSPLAAQEHRAIAKIPFSFEAAGHTLAPGDYEISQLKSSRSVFLIKDTKGESLLQMFGSLSSGTPENPSLTFVCPNGDSCVLTKVAPPSSSVAYGLSSQKANPAKPHLQLASLISIKLQPR